MNTLSSIRWAAVLLTACMLSSCAEEKHAPTPPAEAPAETRKPGQVSAPFDVQKVMERVHFSFRPQGTAWEGGHSTYAVKVEAGGFSVTPYHYPEGPHASAVSPPPSSEARALHTEPPAPEPVEGQAVRFGAAQVARGGVVLASRQAQERMEDTGSLTLARGEVAEHFRNSQDGVEQSWSFERRPEGAGALEVWLPVESGRYLGETAGGLHFAAGPTGMGVRYSHGTWVDSEGRRTPVPARFEGGTIRLRVPAQVLEASAYPAVLDPTVSPEFGMDTPVSGPALDSQIAPVVAHNGNNFLVVWHDSRSGGESDIYGARVSGTGSVLDPNGIAISTNTYREGIPSVAQDGTNFLVVWEDYRNGNGDIYGARVSGTGSVLDPNGIAISTHASGQYNPAVACKVGTCLVVWDDGRNVNLDIYGTRVSGAWVSHPNGIAITTATSHQYNAAVAHDGTNFLVVFQDDGIGSDRSSNISGALLDANGSVLSSRFIISNAVNHQISPAVAYTGTNFLVVWEDCRRGSWDNCSGSDIYGARVNGKGLVLDSNGIAISTASNGQNFPAVAHDGTNFLVVWQELRSGSSYYDIYGARVNGSGSVLDSNGFAIATAIDAHAPGIAYGTNFLVVSSGGRTGLRDIYGIRVSSSRSVLDPNGILISSTVANTQKSPAVAYNGTNFLVVWQDSRGGSWDIYGTRVSGTGSVIDPNGIAISTNYNQQLSPAVAHDGTNFLVVWQEAYSGVGIYGARVSNSGSVLNPQGIVISAAAASVQKSPAVSYNGTNFLVVWQDSRGGNGSDDIYGARVNGTGSVLDPKGIPISTATKLQDSPTVAHDGMDFLVVWQDARNGNGDIYGARVSGAGAVLDPQGVAISTAANAQDAPAVAYNGTNFLVVWQELRSGGWDIYGARVRDDSSVLDPDGIAISTRTNSQTTPAVATNGTSILVVWQDSSSGNGDIYGTWVNGTTGTVLDTSNLAISTEPVREEAPVLASMGEGASLVVYSRLQALTGTNTERVLARLVQRNTPPSATVQSASTTEDTAVDLTLSGSDADGDSLTFSVVQPPQHGSVTLQGTTARYTPEPDYHGADSFTFQVTDTSGAVSSPATVSLTIASVNDVPVAAPMTRSVSRQPTALTLSATDADLEALTFHVESPPDVGTLAGTAPELVYTPPPRFVGSISFTFTASDGQHTSAPASVTLHVINGAPQVAFSASSPTPLEGEAVVFSSQAVDPDGDSLDSLSWDFGDGSPLVTGGEVTHAYADSGTYTVTVTVTDDMGATTRASREIQVSNLPPVPEAVPPQSTTAGQEVRLQLRATDVAGDKDPLTWALVEGPGSLSAEGLYSWDPPPGTHGTFTVRARVSDDDGGASEALFNLFVTASVQDPPAPQAGCGCSNTGGATSSAALLCLLALASLVRKHGARR